MDINFQKRQLKKYLFAEKKKNTNPFVKLPRNIKESLNIDKLNNLNKDFNEFIAKLSKVINATKEYTVDVKSSFVKICDSIFKSDEEFEDYCKSHNIPF
mgnify:CR=1 FL=1